MIKIILSRTIGDRRITQTELSDATGIRLTTIGEWYNDMKDRIDLDLLDKMCESLDCPVGDILEYVPNKNPKVRKAESKKHKKRKP